MATVTITIETDNAAFEDSPRHETARVLRALAHELDGGEPGVLESFDGQKLRDVNGNCVGVVGVTS